MSVDYLKRILTSRVYDVAHKTPLIKASLLSARLQNTILIKREDEQDVFSFKIRGAYNKMAQLSKAARQRGVICASAGNHAQGVAYSARQLQCRAVIVMPISTPEVKVNAVKRLGGEAVLFGESYSDAYEHSLELQKAQGLTFVHPFDDPDVIAGQGTVGMEILSEQADDLDAIFVPIGGGGLIAGVAAYVKALRPEIKIIGVQSEDSCAMIQSIQKGKRLNLSHVGLFSDGTAVKQVGKETLRLAKQYVDDYVTVNTDEICAAIKDVFQDTRSVLEPSGALAIAGSKKYLQTHQAKNKTVVAIASGANMNFDRLRFVAERADVGEEKEAIFAVSMPERKGSFKKLCQALGKRQVTEFNYRMSEPDIAHIFVGVQIKETTEIQKLIANIEKHKFTVHDLSDNDLAKTHLRYMVGGHCEIAQDERLLSFVFPEKPGALSNFLNQMSPGWNISLFHYRNSGGDFGRVLVGIQVPSTDNALFDDFLNKIGYPHQEETGNPAYRWFLD
ncbi:threonine ammonia-lyase, biosynthetic [Brackiella oedipodis]|uniref:threonine ammonia-lyase, biosynthetic n=1 Tax=Brackiella oedipodis TaxID=124225 RepID=UPI000491452A|nr:threonine ammonia-lyase, biosynthetic [Brackiella oedipodis]